MPTKEESIFFESGSHDKTMTKLGPENKQSYAITFAITFLTLFIIYKCHSLTR